MQGAEGWNAAAGRRPPAAGHGPPAANSREGGSRRTGGRAGVSLPRARRLICVRREACGAALHVFAGAALELPQLSGAQRRRVRAGCRDSGRQTRPLSRYRSGSRLPGWAALAAPQPHTRERAALPRPPGLTPGTRTPRYPSVSAASRVGRSGKSPHPLRRQRTASQRGMRHAATAPKHIALAGAGSGAEIYAPAPACRPPRCSAAPRQPAAVAGDLRGSGGPP